MPRPFSLAFALAALLAMLHPGREALAANEAKSHAGPAPVAQTSPQRGDIEKTLARITLPPGFAIALYALVPEARAMAVAADGRTIFVGTNGEAVYAIHAASAGGPVQAVTRFAPAIKMVMPHGVCLAPDRTLYLAEQNRILAFPDAAARTADPSPTVSIVVAQGKLIPPAEESDTHSARVCRVGPDNKLYVTVGQPFNVPPASKQALYAKAGLGAILRMDRDGAHREIFAGGIRNSVGLDFNPRDGLLWFTDNQVDMMGDDIPPGEINRVTQAGQNFGFPWYGGGHVRTREYKRQVPPSDVVFPQVETVAHAADLGMTFYHGERFPALYRGGIFSAQHGSWNRTVPVGARVMFTVVKPDGTAGASTPFAEGWKQPDGSYAGRPNDVAELPDGSLLVSDDDAGAVYRISYGAP